MTPTTDLENFLTTKPIIKIAFTKQSQRQLSIGNYVINTAELVLEEKTLIEKYLLDFKNKIIIDVEKTATDMTAFARLVNFLSEALRQDDAQYLNTDIKFTKFFSANLKRPKNQFIKDNLPQIRILSPILAESVEKELRIRTLKRV